MIYHAWTVLCDHTEIDKTNNAMSLITVIRGWVIAGLHPAAETQRIKLKGSSELASFWYADGGEPRQGQVRVVFVAPSGGSVGEFQFELDLRKKAFHREVIKVEDLVITGEEGLYYFKVQLRSGHKERWRNIAQLPVTIDFATTEQPDS
jgi:hypothetical protein